MAFWNDLKKQFIEVIDWVEPGNDVLAYRFPVADNEIKDGAQLTVRDSQAALFVDQGQTADVFSPGRHTLSSENLPLLTKLESWSYGFKSPFKCEVYFYSLRQKLGQKWGTRQPITIRDPEFGSVQLRMFGAYSYHVADVRAFYREVSGTRDTYTTEELVDHLLPLIAGTVAPTFARSKLSFLDMAENLPLLSTSLREALEAPFAKIGLALDSFVVEAVSLPDDLQEALRTRQSMAIVGDLTDYTRYQAGKSLSEAARNPSGLAGVGAGIAAGAGLGRVLGDALEPKQASGAAQPDTRRASAGAGAGAGAGTDATLTPCTACSQAIEPGSAFCRFCGSPQAASCPTCRAPVAKDSAFCAKCGQKLGSS